MTRDELTALVLAEVSKQCEAVCTQTPPPKWRWWESREYEDDREFGPRYTPTWFGELTDTEAGRQRVLRTLYRLDGAGLIEVVKSEGGRLERVRMTTGGRRRWPR